MTHDSDDHQYQFEFFEIVTINSDSEGKKPIDGKRGRISGRAVEDGVESYAVFIYDIEECWSAMPDELEATGEVDKVAMYEHENRESIRVKVDPDGSGRLVE